MTIITTEIIVAPDGTMSGRAPDGVPPGRHRVSIAVADVRKPRRKVQELPVHHGHWDDSISLRRDDLYGDGGR